MAVIRYRNQSEYAFLTWMGAFPETSHPFDMERFYIFAKTVARYRNKRWLRFSYFERRVLRDKPHFSRSRLNTLLYLGSREWSVQ